MNLRVNQDGNFFARFVAAAIPAGISVLISICAFAVMFWSDSKTVDAKTADAITRIEKRIDTVEAEAREFRKGAAEDRQKIAEMAAELRSTSRGVSRIEGILDRWAGSLPPRP